MTRDDPATDAALSALLDLVRIDGPALLAHQADPHGELLSLIWCRRFDRDHAMRLLAQVEPPLCTGLARDLLAAADLFDHLGSAAQQRLCRLVARHQGLARTPQWLPCTVSC